MDPIFPILILLSAWPLGRALCAAAAWADRYYNSKDDTI